jgi:methylmalonyl-CoA mutase cobalamin-binding domain/chain
LGGITPQMDYDFLERAGVSAIYGPGTNIPKIAAEIPLLDPKASPLGVKRGAY